MGREGLTHFKVDNFFFNCHSFLPFQSWEPQKYSYTEKLSEQRPGNKERGQHRISTGQFFHAVDIPYIQKIEKLHRKIERNSCNKQMKKEKVCGFMEIGQLAMLDIGGDGETTKKYRDAEK